MYSIMGLSMSIAYSYVYEDENEFKRFGLYMTNHSKVMLAAHATLALVLYHAPSSNDWKPKVTTAHVVSVYLQNEMLVLLCQVSFSFWTVLQSLCDLYFWDVHRPYCLFVVPV